MVVGVSDVYNQKAAAATRITNSSNVTIIVGEVGMPAIQTVKEFKIL